MTLSRLSRATLITGRLATTMPLKSEVCFEPIPAAICSSTVKHFHQATLTYVFSTGLPNLVVS